MDPQEILLSCNTGSIYHSSSLGILRKTFPHRTSVKEEAESVDTWELASAMVDLQTSRNKLRVCDKYVR